MKCWRLGLILEDVVCNFSRCHLQVVGVYGPLPGSPHAVDLDPKSDMGYYRQSVTFVAL